MNSFDSTILTRMLWDLDQTQERITTVSRYIGKNATHAAECISIWEEQLNDCYGDRKLLFLYVLNDVIQVFRGSEVSKLFISRLDSVLYAVIRDCPSLLSKVNRLISVWKDRSVVDMEKIYKYEMVVEEAIKDFEQNIDRRHEQADHHEEEENSDPNEGGDYYQNDDIHSVSSNSFDDQIPLESDNFAEMKENEKNQFLYERVLLEGSQVATAEQEIDQFRHNLHTYPDWVLSMDDFSREFPDLVTDHSTNVSLLYDAMRIAINMRESLERAMDSRKRLHSSLVEMKELKEGRIRRLEEVIRESENVLDLLQSVDEGEENMIIRTIRQPRLSKINSLNVSREAIQSISNTLKKAEEEEEKREQEEKEKQKREAEIRDSMNHSIMKTSAEELRGKAWNARALFDRIL